MKLSERIRYWSSKMFTFILQYLIIKPFIYFTRYSEIIIKSFLKLRQFESKKTISDLDILELPEDSKYEQIKKGYKRLLFKYKPNLEKDFSEETKNVLNAFNNLKSQEYIYLDSDWFDNELNQRFSEVLSNLEKRTITITEHNIKSRISDFKMKYPKLIDIVRKKYVRKVISENQAY
ncbi:putative heat shock protein [Pseudoloma neurophilia]|uniref:Putative heat shock protein n=1 Tax=Pseudoloma neurophilia TaxID=146866 RepID=A0A0R0M3H7_9MICR|nr:putative heat shock protein [Pseudoloma neurophilia]